ncbi:MAG: hypothetical protein Q9170_004207 [Blastenia crenularia]
MALLQPGFPALAQDLISLYYTKDPLLENLPVLVFYGASTTSNATRSNTRIQAHIYSLAGLQSFPRLTIAPTSPLYAAVNHLPSDRQGDEICRGLAVSLLSYFAGLSGPVKDALKESAGRRRPNRMAPAMFDEMHAGELASNMVKFDDVGGMIRQLSSTLSQQSLSWIDIDVVLPPNTIQRAVVQEGSDLLPAFGDDGLPLYSFGEYDPIINHLGHPAFLPTSKLRRAPSRPTAYSKSRILSKEQKIALRREMCELLDTEKNYVAKLQSLVNEVSIQFRQISNANIQNRGLRHDKGAVDQLFPECLSRIMIVNSDFLTELEDILSATEDEAIKDIDDIAEDFSKLQLGHVSGTSRKRDPTGTLAFAKSFLEWLPRFSSPYQEYMRASTSLPDALSAARDDVTSSLSYTLAEFGEQRLRSMLIEPVQRLPRYSLLLDNMIGQLPASHPAINSLLKSKDTLADICALESSGLADSARTSNTLRKYISHWPSWLSPRGRLIAAVDAIDVGPPYSDVSSGQSVVLLLFPDTLIIVRKQRDGALSAKGILAEVDRSAITAFQDAVDDSGLLFFTAFDLSKLQVFESSDNRTLRMTHAVAGSSHLQAFHSGPVSTSGDAVTKLLVLLGPYEGKAYRLSEDIVKARIEGRFSEPIRESDKWALRTIDPAPGSLGIVAAIYEHSAISKIDAIRAPGRFRVEVGGDENLATLLSRNSNLEVAAQIIALDHDRCKLDIQGKGVSICSETSTIDTLSQAIVKKASYILSSQVQRQTQASSLAHVSFNREVLRGLPVSQTIERTGSRSSRPLSPIKLVSNLFGSSNNQTESPPKWRIQAPKLRDVPPIPPPKSFDQITNSEMKPSNDDPASISGTRRDMVSNPFEALELTFNAYIVALRSRSGNVVGRILRNRASADELAVNELYNILIEDPSRIQAAAEVSTDVLFSAFEKFLSKAWQERMGAMLPQDILVSMTSVLDLGRPTEFAQQFRSSLEEMSPQNRRGFSAAIKLLSDLLDASGNDGDRGALMASFAEVLVSSKNPHDSIMLFDRVVDDYDGLFGETESMSPNVIPGTGSAEGSLNQSRSANTGSLSSNASSLKKRFGFGSLSRENSKSESESKVASVWRTLSKNAKSPGDNQQQPGSLSKGSLIRSRSTDTDPKVLPQLRPSSRDRPTPPNASPREGTNSRPTSSHMNTSLLTTIGENTPTKTPSVLRRKRRSSLSDLKAIQKPPSVAAWQPLQPRKLPQPVTSRGTPPMTPSNARQLSSLDNSQRFRSPDKYSSQFRGSPPQKENSPLQSAIPRQQDSPSTNRYKNSKPPAMAETNQVTIKTLSPKKRSPSSSGIPAPRTGLSERAWPPNVTANNASPSKTTSPQKLRIQSPQKLRERLSNEQKALSGAESSLRAEIAKIGEEMSTYRLPRSDNPSASDVSSLASRLDSLSETIASLASDLRLQYTSLSKDIESSLLVSERKTRKLDELYKESNAENEALYERFNDELGKVLKGVKGGVGVEELRKKVKEGEDETARLRKENGRLKREVVGLRSQLAPS